MCSIFGIVDFENRCDTGLIFPQSAPGRRSIYITNYALLLHRHSKNAASENETGSMTLAFCERLYTVVYRGKIADSKKLRQELNLLGANFTCGGAAELFIYSYIMYGKHCTEKLNGDFVCSIYDEQGESLFLMRCSDSGTNFYYTLCDTSFVFSTNYDEVEKYTISKLSNTQAGMIEYMKNKSCIVFDKTGINQQKDDKNEKNCKI